MGSEFNNWYEKWTGSKVKCENYDVRGAWQHQQSKVDELQKRVDDLEKSQNSLELKAEESECVSMCLDDRAVAKCDEDGTEYSLWGRVCQFKKSNNVTEDDLERIYWEFDSERSKSDERLSFKNALRGLLEQALKGEQP